MEPTMTELRAPLYEVAAGAGASFQEWHGWKLPHAYGDVPAEYRAAREGAALHDASYVGRIRATGDDVLDLLHRLSTNDLASIPHGQGAPTILTSDRGRIIDLVTVLNLGDHVLLLTSPETPETVLQWLDKYTIVEDVTLEDVTASTAMISVMGQMRLAYWVRCPVWTWRPSRSISHPKAPSPGFSAISCGGS